MGVYLLPAALIVYVVGIFLAVLGIAYRSDAARQGSVVVLAVAWVLQLGAIVGRVADVGGFAITNTAEYLLVLGWAVLTLYLVVWLIWRVHVLGVILPPIAAVMGFGSYQLLAPATPAPRSGFEGWFLFHTTISTLGMAVLCVTLAMSVLYLFQDSALKGKRTLRMLERLPALDACDRIGLHSLGVGFALLTVGIATGMVVSANVHQTWWSGETKQVFPVLAWILFAAILVSRRLLGFRGRKSAYLTIAGVTLGLLTVVGMTL